MPTSKLKVKEELHDDDDNSGEEDEQQDTNNEDDDMDSDKDEENEEDEEGSACDDTDEATANRLKAQLRNKRRNARQAGYRKWAKLAGLRSGRYVSSFGNDMQRNVFSKSDITRMANWCPHTADVGIELSEFKAVLRSRNESLSSGPAKILQANVESFARKLIGDLVMRSMETQSSMTITAANVKSVLRPFNDVLHREFSTPLGLVRAAQHVEKNDETVLPRVAEEDACIAEERKFCRANHAKLMREADRKQGDKMNARKKMKTTHTPTSDSTKNTISAATAVA